MSDDAVNKTDGGAPEGSGKKPSFSPAVAGSYVFPVAERLQRLRELQNEECWAHQRPNIAKAIEMYESGELPLPGCREIFFANGEVLDRLPDTIARGVYLWTEVGDVCLRLAMPGADEVVRDLLISSLKARRWLREACLRTWALGLFKRG